MHHFHLAITSGCPVAFLSALEVAPGMTVKSGRGAVSSTLFKVCLFFAVAQAVSKGFAY